MHFFQKIKNFSVTKGNTFKTLKLFSLIDWVWKLDGLIKLNFFFFLVLLLYFLYFNNIKRLLFNMNQINTADRGRKSHRQPPVHYFTHGCYRQQHASTAKKIHQVQQIKARVCVCVKLNLFNSFVFNSYMTSLLEKIKNIYLSVHIFVKCPKNKKF